METIAQHYTLYSMRPETTQLFRLDFTAECSSSPYKAVMVVGGGETGYLVAGPAGRFKTDQHLDAS